MKSASCSPLPIKPKALRPTVSLPMFQKRNPSAEPMKKLEFTCSPSKFCTLSNTPDTLLDEGEEKIPLKELFLVQRDLEIKSKTSKIRKSLFAEEHLGDSAIITTESVPKRPNNPMTKDSLFSTKQSEECTPSSSPVKGYSDSTISDQKWS